MNRFVCDSDPIVFSIPFLLYRRFHLQVFYHMSHLYRVHKKEPNQRSPIRGFQLPQTLRYALLGGEAREQDRRLPGDIGSMIPDMYIETLLELHYSEHVTQVLPCLLEEKCIQKERCVPIRPRWTRLIKWVEPLSRTIAMDRQSTSSRRSSIRIKSAEGIGSAVWPAVECYKLQRNSEANLAARSESNV